MKTLEAPRPVADTETPAQGRLDAPEAGPAAETLLLDTPDTTLELPKEEETYEHVLADKLVNPELKGTRKIKDTMNRYAVETVNKVATVAQFGRDVPTAINHVRLRAKKDRAERKLNRLKTKTSMFKWRRKRLAKKVNRQEQTFNARNAAYKQHQNMETTRMKNRTEARLGRYDAYEEKREALKTAAQNAAWSKARRRYKRLERVEKRPVTPEMREKLAGRRKILEHAFLTVWEQYGG